MRGCPVADGAKQLVYGQLGGQSQVYVDPDGVKVTNGTDDRIELGRLSDGTYGLRVRTGKLGSGTQTVVDDNGVAVTTGGVERVRLGALGGGDYGLKVVNAGTTVIIDGSSNMFKIAATGTFSVTGCDGSAVACTASNSVTIATGLSVVPAHTVFMEYVTGRSVALPRLTTIESPSVGDFGSIVDSYRAFTEVVLTNQTKVTVEWLAYNVNRAAVSFTFRYYIFQEVGI